jgi:hypothetical protein
MAYLSDISAKRKGSFLATSVFKGTTIIKA